MSTAPRITPQWALDHGFRPIPLWKDDYGDIKKPNRPEWEKPDHIFQPHNWKQREGTGLGCGLQPSGLYLYFADYDDKSDLGIDAVANRQAALAKLRPELRQKLFKAISTKGKGRYLAFLSRREFPSADLKNDQGQKIGDFLGPLKQVVAPTPDRWEEGSMLDALPIFDDAETDEVLDAIGYWTSRTEDTDLDSTLDWNEVEHCYGMIDGLLKRIGQHTITYKQLHGDGGTDRSATRFGLACELSKRFAYPEEEIAAILFHFDFGHLKEKGTKWLKGDIARCISKAIARYPGLQTKPSYCRLLWKLGKPLPLPQVEPPRRGRPQVTTGDTVLAWYQANNDAGKVMMRRADIAQALGISVPTLDRYNRQLKAAGLIEIHTVRKGRQTYSYVAILSAIKNTQNAQPEAAQTANFDSTKQPIAKRQNRNQAVLKERTHLPDSPAREPSLAEAVRAMRAAGAKNRKHLKRMLGEYFPGHTWAPKLIDRVYDNQRRADTRERSREYWQRLDAMTVQELQRALKTVDRRIGLPSAYARRSREQDVTHRKNLLLMLDRKLADAKRETRKKPPSPALFDVALAHSAEVCFPAAPQAQHPPPRINPDTAWFDLQRMHAERAEQAGNYERAAWFRSLIPAVQGMQHG